MKVKQRISRRGFTMIELLVVVLIIALLSGILLKAAAALQSKSNRARAGAQMEILANLLSAFNAEYATYPPTQSVIYEFECAATNFQSRNFKTFLKNHNNPNDPGTFFPDCNARLGEGSHWPKATYWSDSLGYRYGLVSFLWPRRCGDQPHWFDYDTARDIAAKDSWAGLSSMVPRSGGMVPHGPPSGLQSLQPYTNSMLTIKDPWGRDYHYRSVTPYTRYRIWSVGPDGKDGTPDDIDNEQGAGIF